MKTYKYLFLLFASLSIVGCSDLEEEPVGLLTSPDDFFQTTLPNIADSLDSRINDNFQRLNPAF